MTAAFLTGVVTVGALDSLSNASSDSLVPFSCSEDPHEDEDGEVGVKAGEVKSIHTWRPSPGCGGRGGCEVTHRCCSFPRDAGCSLGESGASPG